MKTPSEVSRNELFIAIASQEATGLSYDENDHLALAIMKGCLYIGDAIRERQETHE